MRAGGALAPPRVEPEGRPGRSSGSAPGSSIMVDLGLTSERASSWASTTKKVTAKSHLAEKERERTPRNTNPTNNQPASSCASMLPAQAARSHPRSPAKKRPCGRRKQTTFLSGCCFWFPKTRMHTIVLSAAASGPPTMFLKSQKGSQVRESLLELFSISVFDGE